MTPAAERPPLSRALCCSLPLRDGDTAAIIGWSAPAAAAARDFGATTLVVADPTSEHAAAPDRLPLGDASVDHAILNAVTPATRSVVPRELGRVVRPGGTVLVVTRARWIRGGGGPDAGPRWTDRHLRAAGLTDVRSYGIRPTLHDARYVIPFGCPAALAWYVHSFVSAATFRSSFASSAMRVVPASHALLGRLPTRMLRPLFPAVALRAVRPGPAARP